MAFTPVLLPGNMCDARLWHGGGNVLRTMFAAHSIKHAFDADLTRDDSIAGIAQRTLAATKGRLLPVGFSMGAIVAIEMAMQAPDRIVGLVLAGYNATADLPERSAHRPTQQAEVRAGGLERVLVEELKPNYLALQNRNDNALLMLLRDMGISIGSDVFICQSEALRLRGDRRNILPKLNIPVLFMCGAEDTLCPPAWHENWAELTPLGCYEEIVGAGHMLPLEAPIAFAAAIEHWLKHNEMELA